MKNINIQLKQVPTKNENNNKIHEKIIQNNSNKIKTTNLCFKLDQYFLILNL